MVTEVKPPGHRIKAVRLLLYRIPSALVYAELPGSTLIAFRLVQPSNASPSMLVTLEQESLLTSVHGPLEGMTKRRVRDLMRRYGVRLANAGKNTGKFKFAFNPLQTPFLPEPLRPPMGTGGNAKT